MVIEKKKRQNLNQKSKAHNTGMEALDNFQVDGIVSACNQLG